MLKVITTEKTLIFLLITLISGISVISAILFILQIEIGNLYNALILIVFLVFSFGVIKKKINFIWSYYMFFFFIFTFYLGLNYFFISDTLSANKKFLLFLGNGLLISIITSSIKDIQFVKKTIIFYSIVNSMIFLFLYLFYDINSDFSWFLHKEIGIDIIYMSRAVALGFLSIFFFYQKEIKLFQLLFLFPIFLILILINEVGPILAVLLVLFYHFSRKKIMIAIVAFILTCIFYLFFITQFIQDLTIEKIFDDPRVEIYYKNFKYFLNEPIFGIGWSGSESLLGSYQSAHNIFIEILAEFGLVGIVGFLILMYHLFNKFLIINKNQIIYFWLFSFIVVQFSGDIALNPIFWFFSALMVTQSNKIYFENSTYN